MERSNHLKVISQGDPIVAEGLSFAKVFHMNHDFLTAEEINTLLPR